uniref:Uncharacterized protein n=1 Tax=Anguilla anguilla TaxID=7936 RepID=A0A0E9UM42_ANGAN
MTETNASPEDLWIKVRPSNCWNCQV